ncbi:MAG: transaldolase family protein [Phycisphaerae bacterium]
MSIQSLADTGTKVWLDSVDPDYVQKMKDLGVTGATSNPVIIAGIIKAGGLDEQMAALFERGMNDEGVCWALTDLLVSSAQEIFQPVWEATACDDGWVSFELDPLLEDPEADVPHADRVTAYKALARQWGKGYTNRMIKIPATPAGIEALEDVVADGLTVNVTLIFSDRQYKAARDAVWRGAQRLSDTDRFKSVFSIFISRIDVYTAEHLTELSDAAQGQVGLVNAKRLWKQNQDFWAEKNLPLKQEIIFASTGTKVPSDPKDKYVAALAGSDIQTNPPEVNEAIQESGKAFTNTVDQLPDQAVLDEIDQKVDFAEMERVLMEEGVEKFAKPQRQLLEAVREKRRNVVGA